MTLAFNGYRCLILGHDWHYLLSTFGVLSWDAGLALLVGVMAFVIWGSVIALGGWLCFTIARAGEAFCTLALGEERTGFHARLEDEVHRCEERQTVAFQFSAQ